MDKVEEERQAVLEAQQKADAAKRAKQEAKRKAEDDAKKSSGQGGTATPKDDAEMNDVEMD